MSVSVGNTVFPFVSATLLALTLPGCESNGSYRVASVGAAGPQGAQGIAGPPGEAGEDGGAGLAGLKGIDGANAIASGGLVGPGGAAGTGLLANTGDPANRTPAVSGVLIATGEAASAGAGRGAPLAERVDNATPGGLTITGRVIRTADNGGQALVRAGDGRDYLVDGLAASTGQLVTVNVQEQRVLGANGDRPLIGATALAPSAQQQGDLLTVGAGNRDRAVTLGTPAGGTQQGAASPVTGVVGRATQPLGTLRRGGN